VWHEYDRIRTDERKPMKLKIEIWTRFEIVYGSTEPITLEAHFDYKGKRIEIKFDHSEFKELTLESGLYRYKEFSAIPAIIDWEGSTESFLEWSSSEENKISLFSFLFDAVNLITANFRIHGNISDLKPDKKRPEKYKEFFSKYGVSISNDGTEWKPVRFLNFLQSMVSTYSETHYKPSLQINNWKVIEENLITRTKNRPESEFVSSAISHIRQGNLRLAVFESVVGLEIALGQFLKMYLEIEKKIPIDRIAKFLKPDLGLTGKVACLLDLCLDRKSMEGVNIDSVLKVITARNAIVHQSGNLPEDTDEEGLKLDLYGVLDLIEILAIERDVLRIPWIKFGFIMKLSKDHALPIPRLQILENNKICLTYGNSRTDFNFGDEDIHGMANAIEATLHLTQPEFRKERSLIMLFINKGGIQKRYLKGSIVGNTL
jgi:hypothetical protein